MEWLYATLIGGGLMALCVWLAQKYGAAREQNRIVREREAGKALKAKQFADMAVNPGTIDDTIERLRKGGF